MKNAELFHESNREEHQILCKACFTSELLESVPQLPALSRVLSQDELSADKSKQNRFLTCRVKVVLSLHRLDIMSFGKQCI